MEVLPVHQYQEVVKDFLIEYVIEMRESKSLTKTAMSVWLCIDPRSYFELERGRFSMSAASLLCFQAAWTTKKCWTWSTASGAGFSR